ncbi:shikimate dehydrogenase [candidate division KSB3 bacterium]|uniref:Multifunctional fusion protein n=1 Tax=candidate division KSB3 bacterium TaxID=2044937 RepID=A0A9D5JYM0_9BACT|nr:shikimate dehydrogenase [candidate division KSB3 bacterium]MBD3326618.1 shikimate dehydrogenase [candidate division KSB3 bacterium]
MKLFAVFGKPVLHSRSPQIWNQAFKRLGIPASYVRINPIDAEQAVNVIRELPLCGCNVTTPFKADMVDFIDQKDESVEILGAANTIKNDNGTLIGFNTDAYGVVNSLKEAGVAPQGKKIIVLGAGGAARAAVYGLLKAGTQDVILMNRTYEKAVKAADRLGCQVAYFGRAKSEIQTADILISCIPSNRRIVKKDWLHPGLAVFDANYASGESPLLLDARDAGCQVISGLHWLVHQAAPAFDLFFEVDPSEFMQEAIHHISQPASSSIAVIGFMGAGKTSIGGHLANMLDVEFLDTDALIEQRAGESIPEIFRKYGEARFREIERAVFDHLDFTPAKVISCGGGAIKDEKICQRLRQNCTVVWLWSSLSTTMARIRRGTRPLLDTDDIENHARRIFTERLGLYAECAGIMFVNETRSTKHIAQKIYDEIHHTRTH